ncbi:MAG TPA: hypothetical protein VMV10_26420 [Pirellulales bacterium]|nr:hypothetical protein [Pirellulales bacterium]
MADRERVVAMWRARLAFWRERLEARRPWVARAYVRVLSFLLARYAPEQKTTAGDATAGDSAAGGEASSLAEEPDDERSRMAFYEAPAVGAGKPARSVGAIRSMLETVRENQPQRERAGPLAAGLPGDEWIAVAAFYDPAEVERLRRMLGHAGIEVRVERFRRMQKALVRMADKDRAQPIVLEHAADCRDSSRRRKQYAEAWIKPGAACGAVLDAILFAVLPWAAGFALPDARYYLFFSLFGAVVGVWAGAVVGFLAGTIADG